MRCKMVERVATAMAKTNKRCSLPWLTDAHAEPDSFNVQLFMPEARAGIAAMRSPTASMRYAIPDRIAEKLTYREIGDVWRAMIDAALKEIS